MDGSTTEDPFVRNEIWIGENRLRSTDELPDGISIIFHRRSVGNVVRLAANNRWRALAIDLASAIDCTVDVGAIRVNFGGIRISFVANNGRYSKGVSISIGDGCIFNGSTHVIGPLTPGLHVSIGRDCLFASQISIRGSSHHGLWDKSTGRLLNPEAGITVGDHVWLGDQVVVLNKASIPSGSVVAARSVVNKSFDEPNVLIAGVPAAIRRHDILWSNDFPLDNGATARHLDEQ